MTSPQVDLSIKKIFYPELFEGLNQVNGEIQELDSIPTHSSQVCVIAFAILFGAGSFGMSLTMGTTWPVAVIVSAGVLGALIGVLVVGAIFSRGIEDSAFDEEEQKMVVAHESEALSALLPRTNSMKEVLQSIINSTADFSVFTEDQIKSFRVDGVVSRGKKEVQTKEIFMIVPEDQSKKIMQGNYSGKTFYTLKVKEKETGREDVIILQEMEGALWKMYSIFLNPLLIKGASLGEEIPLDALSLGVIELIIKKEHPHIELID